MRHHRLEGLIPRACLFLLSLLAVPSQAWSMNAAPSPSIDGNYTVTWTSPTGCSFTEPWPGWPVFHCYMLQENNGSGTWTGVSTSEWATSWNAYGKSPGTYQYRIFYSYGDIYSYNEYVIEGLVSVDVGVPTLPAAELQAYAVRSGDLDYDGDIDVYVKRVAGSSWQLPL